MATVDAGHLNTPSHLPPTPEPSPSHASRSPGKADETPTKSRQGMFYMPSAVKRSYWRYRNLEPTTPDPEEEDAEDGEAEKPEEEFGLPSATSSQTSPSGTDDVFSDTSDGTTIPVEDLSGGALDDTSDNTTKPVEDQSGAALDATTRPAGAANGFADQALLDKIDKLFACGVGEYIDLPQLVVVGDQSSGKSSVLEGLTNLPFPRDSGLCTRFATQITFRRSEETLISVSILPAKNASPEHVAQVLDYKSEVEELDTISFARVMSEVKTVMGLGSSTEAGINGTFSEDVLKLEVAGPDQEHFSVVDVPGIFRKTTEGVTTKADRQMVQHMVHSYMENARSVMLTVCPANADIATQEILSMAEEWDPEGLRTLGVLTKPDLVDAGAEASVMDLVAGRRHQLKLGWCIVRNPGQRQLSDPSADRKAIEDEFFRTQAPWNRLDKDKVGVDTLRVRLQEVLADHIRLEFPKVRAEIQARVGAAKKNLDGLGTRRETALEQMQYLLTLSNRFQGISTHALAANYAASDSFDAHPQLRLPTLVVNRNEKFGKHLDRHGHSYVFYDDQDNQELEDICSPISGDFPKTSETSPAAASKQITIRETPDAVDIEDLLLKQTVLDAGIDQTTPSWLLQTFKNSRGFELGTFDSSILAMTMKTQTAKWEPLALGYISDIISMTHSFITTLLERICPNRRVNNGIMAKLLDELTSRYRNAYKQVEFLLHVERYGTPATLNHYFNDNLEASRQSRIRRELEKVAFETGGGGGRAVKVDAVVRTHPMSNTEHTLRDIHDILKAYYKVARKRFVDNVCMQAADFHLVTGPHTPLKLFSSEFVGRLSGDDLEAIAGEDPAMKRKRRNLEREIVNLEAGRKILV